MKYFLEYGKISSIKHKKNRFWGRNEALVSYKTAEEANTALADINMYQGWAAELYRKTSIDKQVGVHEGYRDVRNNTVERSQQKDREYKYQ